MKPFAHQQLELDQCGTRAARALWWEPGLGKTKTVLDSLKRLFEAGEVAGALVLAPQGVAANWVRDEIPKHLPEAKTFLWESQRRTTLRQQASLDQFLHESGLTILVMSYDAFMTNPLRREGKVIERGGGWAARNYLESGRRLYVLDESSRIKNWNKTTQRVLASSKYAQYRRVLNGTPITESPFNAYFQCLFLDPECWRRIGLPNYSDFKTYFGVWTKGTLKDGREYPLLLDYKNLGFLKGVLENLGNPLLKEQVLDLPEKLYQRRYFDLGPEQERMYGALAEEYQTSFSDGSTVTAELAIVRLTRLQQITSGYVPADDEDDLRQIGEANPRLAALTELVGDLSGPAIIWAKYNIDVDLIVEALRDDGHSLVQYDGRTPPPERERARDAFQRGDVRFFVSKPSCAGYGLTLTAARTVIYYDNTFSLEERLQSEDRAHRIGQTHPVTYVDLIAQDTVDEQILEALADKRSLSDLLRGKVTT